MSNTFKIVIAAIAAVIGLIAAVTTAYQTGYTAGSTDKNDRIGALTEDIGRKNEKIEDLKLHCPPPSIQPVPDTNDGPDTDTSPSEVPASASAAYEIDLSLGQAVPVSDEVRLGLTDVIRRGSELEAVLSIQIQGSEKKLSLQQGQSGRAGTWTVLAKTVTPAQAKLLMTEAS